MKTKTKGALILATISMLIFATVLAILVTVPLKVNSKINEQQEETRKFEEWLDKLVAYECPNCQANFRRLDSNGEYSYSCLQFQRRTFEDMAKRYQIPTKLYPSDRVSEPIYSCRIQRAVATAMFEDQGSKAARHWYTSIYVKGLGLPPEV